MAVADGSQLRHKHYSTRISETHNEAAGQLHPRLVISAFAKARCLSKR